MGRFLTPSGEQDEASRAWEECVACQKYGSKEGALHFQGL